MSINNHNVDTELNDVNLGALAISDGNNNDDDEGGQGVNIAELLGVPDDHPMAQFFNVSGLTEKVVLFGGVQVAGKICCTSKDAWDVFGGDDNWNKLLAVHTLPLVYTSLGHDTLGSGPSMSYLKRLLTDTPAAPRPPPKPLSEYSFEVKCDILGKKLHSFVAQGIFSETLGIFIPLPSNYGSHLIHAFKAGGGAPDGGRIIDGSLVVRVFDRINGKFATFSRTGTMRMHTQPEGPAGVPCFEANEAFGVIHDHLDVIDVPGASPRSPIFHTHAVIMYIDDGRPFLSIPFFDTREELVKNKDQILRLMERLEWK